MAGVLAAAGFLTACQQQKPYPIFFLTEEPSASGNSARMIVMYNGRPYTRLPILNQDHLESFSSFMNMQDGSYGVEFLLKSEMRNRLFAVSQEKQGMRILPVVNGLAFQPVLLDRPVTDGKLVIWGGLNGYDLKEIARTITPADPEKEKKRFLDKNPRPIPKLEKDVRGEQRDHTGRMVGELTSGSAS